MDRFLAPGGHRFCLFTSGLRKSAHFRSHFTRTAIAAVGLIALLPSGKRPPLTRTGLFPRFVLGVGNTVIPFVLISWGETQVESGLASVLNAMAALFTLVIAHLTFQDERISTQKVAGLMLGFLGVVARASRSWGDGQIVTGGLAGQVAIVVAAFFYAVFGGYSRKAL